MQQQTTPTATPLNADPLVTMLRHDIDTASQGGTLLIVGGIAISVVSAAIVALVIVGLMNLWFGTSVIGITGWLIVGLLACGAVVGLSLKKPLVVPTGDMNYTHGVPADGIVGEHFYDYPLVGPRMLVAGIKLTNVRPNPAEEHFYDRCALLLRQMAKRGEAMPAKDLLIGDDETPMMLGKVIRYLDRRNWVGASSDQSRVWLSTRGKNELLKMGLLKV